jgi:hypothetical protein
LTIRIGREIKTQRESNMLQGVVNLSWSLATVVNNANKDELHVISGVDIYGLIFGPYENYSCLVYRRSAPQA